MTQIKDAHDAKMFMPKVLIACGGTGGHIFPAIALAQSVRRHHPQAAVLFAGTFNPHMTERLRSLGYGIEFIAGRGMPHRFNALILPFIVKLFLSLTKAFCILKRHRPDIVVSMGSFSGGPFVLAAKFRGSPSLIHEQNVAPGRANRISAYFTDRIATSFSQTADFFSKASRRKIICTGNPVRREIFGLNRSQALELFALEAGKFTILVMGGSQGAHTINKLFVEVARGLDRDKFQILHLTGKTDFEFVSREYKQIGIRNKVISFLDDMGSAYAASDLVVCRSGAITVTEITALGLASVLIPYPHGDYHQLENAKVLKSAGAAFVIQEKYLTSDTLSALIKELSQDRSKLEDMRNNSRKLARPDAAESLAAEVAKLVEKP